VHESERCPTSIQKLETAEGGGTAADRGEEERSIITLTRTAVRAPMLPQPWQRVSSLSKNLE